MESCSGGRTYFIADAEAQLHPAQLAPQTHVNVAVAAGIQLAPGGVRRAVEDHAATPVAPVSIVEAGAAVV